MDALAGLFEPEAYDILDEQYVNRKQQEDAALENIKEEYGFHEIKDAFDEAAFPHQLDFFYGEDDENFIRAIEFLSPSSGNREFTVFLLSEKGKDVMTSSSLLIL